MYPVKYNGSYSKYLTWKVAAIANFYRLRSKQATTNRVERSEAVWRRANVATTYYSSLISPTSVKRIVVIVK